MKQISASIIVLSGAGLIIGSYQFVSDTQTFIIAVGCVVVVCGLWGWFMNIKEK